MARRPGLWRAVPLVVVMGTLFFLSHQPGTSLPQELNRFDKLLHLLAYAVLGLSFLFALAPPWRRQHPWAAGGWTIFFCLAYGVSDEFHQMFVPGRCAGVDDLVADVAGGLVAVCLWRLGRRVRGG
ncbi:MAG: VanZ family protein [Desulfobulbus sp.]